MSFILLGVLNSQAAGAGGLTSFVGKIKETSYQIYATSITTDVDDNIYISPNTSNGYPQMTIKLDSAGNEVWRHALGLSASNPRWTRVDQNGNSYQAGTDGSNLVCIKRDSSGVVQWQYKYNYSTYSPHSQMGMDVDNAGNYVYMSGVYRDPSQYWFQQFLKINSSNGTLAAQNAHRTNNTGSGNQMFGGGLRYGTNGSFEALAFGGSRRHSLSWDSKYAADRYVNTDLTFPTPFYLGRYNSGTDGYYCNASHYNGSRFVYAGRTRDVSGYNDDAGMVYQGTAGVAWIKAVYATNVNSTVFNDLVQDSSNNVYTVGTYYDNGGTAGRYFALICKFDTNGNLLWQRRFRVSNQYNFTATNVEINANETHLVVSGWYQDASTSINYGWFGRVSVDGSDTGSATVDGTTFTYEPSSLTVTTVSPDYISTFDPASYTLTANSQSATTVTRPNLTATQGELV